MCDKNDDLTPNERVWLRFLRDVSNDSDPGITLRRVQLLRRLCAPRSAWFVREMDIRDAGQSSHV